MKSDGARRRNDSKDNFLLDAPGSPRAVERGCTCSAAENNFGRGRSKDGIVEPHFIPDPNCMLHGLSALVDMLREQGEID